MIVIGSKKNYFYAAHKSCAAISDSAILRQGQPVSPSARQPVSPSARQPVSPSARQPVSPSARQPVSPSARQPVSPSARQPVSPSARQPVSPSARQPVSPSARQPVSPSARQPVSPSARQPVSPSARQPVSPSAFSRARGKPGAIPRPAAAKLSARKVRFPRKKRKFHDAPGRLRPGAFSFFGARRLRCRCATSETPKWRIPEWRESGFAGGDFMLGKYGAMNKAKVFSRKPRSTE